ncbi:MAG: hypothetical protein PHG10_04065 [Sulfurimonas sp.]|nr:hypothetical protein [Sulfurimonas sp.]
MLTTSADTFVGTAKNDLFDASVKGTLQKADVILDSSSTDHDTLNATVSSTGIDARIQNVETLNINGEYVSTGLALTNVTGSKDLNLNTGLAGGTAKVTDANTIAVQNITAKANITKLEVSSLSSGTRDTVNINAGNADVLLTGSSAADKYLVSLAADKTLTVTKDSMISAADALEVNIAGDATYELTADDTAANDELALSFVNNAATESTVTAIAGKAIAKTLKLSGNDIVIDAGDGLSLGGTSVTAGGTKVTSDAAKSTIELSNTLGASKFFNKAVVDNIKATKDLNTVTLTVNEATKVILDEKQTALTMNIDNATGDIASTGTLLLDANADQTKLITGAQIDTVLLTAGKLENDANGVAQTVTIDELDTATTGVNANVVLTGANDLVLTKWTNDADTILNAAGMTGNLTLGTATGPASGTAAASIIILGKGTNTVFAGVTGVNTKITGNTGVDNITLVATAAGINTVDTGAGDDVITTGATGTNNITVGAGNDTVNITNAATVDTITLGSGNNTINMVVESETVIKNINTANDTIVLTGAATTAVNLKEVTPATGAYKVSGAAAADFTLTGSTITDLTSFVQLGNATTAFTAKTNLAVIAGAKDDFIAVDGTSAITTGAGSDTVIVATTQKTATVTDFTTGSDKVVLTGAAANGDSIDLTKVVVSSGKLTLSTNHEITLNNGTNAVLADGTGATAKDASAIVQLGTSTTTTFEVYGTRAAISVTGGKFDDFIEVANSTSLVTINFTDNGGMDTITGFTTAEVALTFGNITGITAASTGFDLTAKTAATVATSGEVYVLASDTSIAGDTIDFSILNDDATTGPVVKITDAVIMEDVVAYLNNALSGVKANHTYVAVIQDNDNTESYSYLINATSDAITTDDITLIGHVDAAVAATDVTAIA